MVRNSHIQMYGTIFNRTIQLLVFTDGIDIIDCSWELVVNTFSKNSRLHQWNLDLVKSEEKTKYKVTEEIPRKDGVKVELGPYKLE